MDFNTFFQKLYFAWNRKNFGLLFLVFGAIAVFFLGLWFTGIFGCEVMECQAVKYEAVVRPFCKYCGELKIDGLCAVIHDISAENVNLDFCDQCGIDWGVHPIMDDPCYLNNYNDPSLDKNLMNFLLQLFTAYICCRLFIAYPFW